MKATSSAGPQATIGDFVGEFISNGDRKIVSGKNAAWYPAKGVMLKVIHRSEDTPPHARIQILPGSPPYSAKLAVEAARYKLSGDKLVATMQLQPGLKLIEELEMRDDGTMKHSLTFDDGTSTSLGNWICIPK